MMLGIFVGRFLSQTGSSNIGRFDYFVGRYWRVDLIQAVKRAEMGSERIR